MPSSHRSWLTLAQAYLRVSELDNLLDLFGSVDDIVTQPRSRLSGSGLSDEKCAAIVSPDDKALDAALRWLEEDLHHLVCWGEDDYPEVFRQIPGPPLLLYVNGDVGALHLPALAIIGSRNPTAGGVRNAHDFAKHLAARGFVIVSGMAQGRASSL